MSVTGSVSGKTLRGKAASPKEIQGFSAYEIAVINGFEGTEEEWLASLHGSKIVSTEYEGEDENGNNIYKQTFDNGHENTFVAPKGDKGDKGDTGDKGDKGDTGAPFTYEDFTEEQLASLKGEKGDKGDQGAQGIQGIQGVQGVQGEKGDKGDSYVLTSADKQEIASLAVSLLPVYEGEVESV